MLRRKAAGSWWGAFLLVAVWHRVLQSQRCDSVSILPCYRLNVCCVFRALESHWELPASEIRELFQAWCAPGTDLALGCGVCYGAGESCTGRRKWTHTVQRYSWAWLCLTFREHFWCFKDIQHFERFLNADLYELSNNFSFYLCFIPMTLGLGIHPWYSQILKWVITTWSLAKVDRLPVVKWNWVCDVWNLGLQSIGMNKEAWTVNLCLQQWLWPLIHSQEGAGTATAL